MSKYKIKYNYNAGSSLTYEEGLEELLELQFDNIEVAKQNLKRIESHYLMNKELNNYPKNNDEKILKKYQNEDWFVLNEKPCIYYTENGKETYQAIDTNKIKKYKKNGYKTGTFIDEHQAKYCIYLFTDKNIRMQISCPWMGYNNSLNFIEIVEDFSDRKIIFNI